MSGEPARNPNVPDDRPMLRFITCGSVDDGKSTLIGRLLHDAGFVLSDHLAALRTDSQRYGTTGQDVDYALLIDGLSAEREQGITIDVAYRYFSTPQRKFIVADTPGHEQYTRNMVTGASTADAAVVLVDARKGLLNQTHRHAYLASLLGVRHLILAVNKMDLVGWSSDAFERISQEFKTFCDGLELASVHAVPISASLGQNLVSQDDSMPWYDGPTLLALLETLDTTLPVATAPFRFPVQWVNRPNQDFRGYSGQIAAGTIKPGDRIMSLPSGIMTHVSRLVTADGDLGEANVGQSITLTLADDIDVARGDMLCAPDSPAVMADQFECSLIWLSDEPMLPGRRYLMKIGTRLVEATISELKYKLDVSTLEHHAAKKLALNEVGFANLSLTSPVAFEPYRDNRVLGGFILIDRSSNATAACGLINFALRRAHNISWQPITIDKRARAVAKHQKGRVVWLTGLSGAGKSTVANLVEQALHGLGRHTYLLDGDNIRHGLNRDLGFTEEDRVENIRRVAEVSRLMVDAGLIVLVSFISPFRAERDMARHLVQADEFVEVYISTPLSVAESRDPKGLYKKARAGDLKNFTGIDSPYEPPIAAEIVIDTTTTSAKEAASTIVEWLERTMKIDDMM